MVLITCHECGGPVSTEATACPRCGAPPRHNATPAPEPDSAKERIAADALDAVHRHLDAGSLIQAVAAYQRATGAGVAESKAAVEQIARERAPVRAPAMAPPLRANRQGQELDTGAKWLIVGAIGTLVAFGAIIAAGAGDNTSSSETFGSAGRSSTAMRALTSNPDTLTSAALVALELELHGDGVSLEHDAAHARFVEVALDSAEALLRKPARNAMQARVLLGALGDATEAQRDRRDEMLGAIEAAEAAQRAVVEREKQRALAALTREVDEFNGITWYKDPSHPRYANNRAFRIYIGEKDGDRWLRMLIRYAGDNWLFVERFVFLVDGVTYTVDPGGHFEVERDNSYGGVWEWYDTKPSDSEMELIRAVANSTSARLRFEGRYRSDWTIPASQRAAIKRVLAAYDALQN